MFGFVKKMNELRDENLELLDKIINLERDKIKAEAELRALKPVVKNKGWKPAMSSDCGECVYVVRSKWNRDIIGCRKDCVCEDFKSKEEPDIKEKQND